MKQSESLPTFKLQQIEEKLSKSELTLKFAMKKYQNLHNQLALKGKIGYDNNQNLLSIFVKITSTSFKPLELILRFIDDADILSIATTCQSLYRFIYSPLGYRIIRSLRPIIIRKKREVEIPTFNKIYLQNLCSQVNLVGMDQDDRVAIIQTMRTNLMAARQKMKQIQKANLEWDKKKNTLKQQINRTISKRQQQQRRIDQIHDQIQKLNQLLQQSSDNIKRLKQQQQKMLFQRQTKKRDLQTEKEKLNHQKELLIKKIKSQQKERQEGLIYARQVSRVTAMLNKLTTKK